MATNRNGLPYETGAENIGLLHLADHPRCGAKLRNKDRRCQAPAMRNGRCRLHGGLSTGAKTPEGKERSRRGNWRHGERSKEYQEEMKALRYGMSLILSPRKLGSLTIEEIRQHREALLRLQAKMGQLSFRET